jgi:Flp pilus assembly CpaE family ATPase
LRHQPSAARRPTSHTDKICLVLNRANSRISAEDLQHALGIPVAYGIVSAGRMMLDAVNEGTTLFAMDPLRRERITQDLATIVELVAGREQPRYSAPRPAAAARCQS